MHLNAYISTITSWLCTVFMVLSVVFGGVAHAKMAPAGLKIENVATAQFTDQSGDSYFLSSQPVITEILPVYSATLTAANDIQAKPDEIVVWPHTLTNTSNIEDSFRFNLIDLGGDSGILKNLLLIHDVNKNGIYDASDIVINPALHVETLDAGQVMNLLVSAQLPNNIPADSVFSVNVQAISTKIPALTRIDNVYTNAPEFKLTKNVNKTELATNGNNASDRVIKYSLNASNIGNSTALGTTVSIEGVNVRKVVFEDPLPAGVVFKDLVYNGGAGGVLLYHVKNTPAKTYRRYEQGLLPNLSQIDKVAIAFDNFVAAQNTQLEVEVSVITSEAISLNNQFVAYYQYGSQNKEAFSNVVSTKLLSYLFELSPATAIVKKPNELAVWKHVLSNTGSVNDAYDLSLVNAIDDNGDLENAFIAQDVNNNGIYEPAIDTVITQVAVAVGVQKTLFVVGTVPATAKKNDVFNTVLNATSQNTQTIRSVIDRVTTGTNVNQLTLTTAPDLIRKPNQLAVWPHILTNTGNAADSYQLSAIDFQSDSGNLENLILVQDVDRDGLYNPAIDTLIVGKVNLNANANIALLVVGTVPATAQANDIFNVTLTAINNAGDSRVVTDKVQAISSPVSLIKEVDNTEIRLVNGQASLKYTLTAQNIGTLDVKAVPIVVEGTAFNKVVLEDKIPVGLQLKDVKQLGSLAGTQVLYRLKGDTSNRYTLYVKGKIADLSQVDSIALAVDSLVPQQTAQLQVDVAVSDTTLGTVFNNQFSLAYRYADVITQDNSNIVTSTILSYQAQLSTAPDLTLDPRTVAVWPHILKNTGNLADNYTLLLNDALTDSGLLQDVQLIHDVNNNGIYDAADNIISASYVISLTPNQSAAILVKAIVPANAKENDVFVLDLMAKGQASGQTLLAVDTVKVVQTVLRLSKIADKPSIDFEDAKKVIDTLTYTLGAENIGSQVLNPIAISIDGINAQKVIFKDALPANVLLLNDKDPLNNGLAAVEYTGTGKILYHLAGQSEHTYVSAANKPSDVKLIDGVVLAHDSFAIGQTDSFKLRVNVYNSATGATVNNILHGYYFYGTEVRQSVSQETPTIVKGSASIQTKDKFYNISARVALNGDVYLEAKCAQCNVRPDFVDRLFLEISSRDSGDVERVVAIETGKNTGIFRISDSRLKQADALPTRSMFEFPVVHGNYIIETRAHDKLTATILWCLDDNEFKRPNTDVKDENGKPVTAFILVDPFGIVFDSKTNAPIAGAVVKLVLVENGIEKPAEIFDDAGLRCSQPRDPNADAICQEIITTGADGAYRFPLVPPTDGINTFYRLIITAPNGYAYPSVVPAAELIAKFNRVVDIKGSYGGTFDVSPTKGPVELDIPMDPPAVFSSSLFIKKTAARQNAELGEFIDYTVVVRNVSPNKTQAASVVVTDRLPKGFSYVAGTARVAKVAQEPSGGKGSILTFNVGNLAADNEVTITYRAHIGVGALHGDGINRVQAKENIVGGIFSNEATAKVKVTAGVFTQEGFVTGKVYTDCNRDGVQGHEEIGVPNVRLILEDGSYVVTDIEGKYNFYGLRATTHVLKLDRTSLPADVELIEQNVRHAGDPSSRFVDLKAGELHRADFAITTDNATCSGPAMTEIYARRNQGDAAIGELERALKADLTFETTNPSDLRSLPANGCINNTGNECGLHGKAKMPVLASAAKNNVETDDIERVKTATDTRTLESYLQDHTSNQLDVLNLTDGQVLPYAQTRILFKGVLGARFEITVNEQLLEDKSVSIKMAVPEFRIEAREYIGINLAAGQNRIALKQFDGLGNVRGTRVLNVIAPDNLASLSVSSNQKVVEANGTNESLLTVKLLDKDGVPVTSRTSVTLESDAGRFRAVDLDPTAQGVQLFVEGGQFSVKLVAPTQAGEAKIRVSSGTYKAETTIRFVPELRPMVAAGIIEGMVSFKDFDSNKVSPAFANDGFEAELQSLANANDGKLNLGGRAAMFLKGKVKGEYLLTLSYDSNKERDQRLFRDIRPDDYYPVYGDSAVRGFDAQSTSKLYVRLDKGRSYVMFGDYTTRIESSEALSLGQYNRSLTGIRGHYATDNFKATTFVAQTKAKQQVFEIPAQGVSGPYVLTGVDGLRVNSEKVEIIKRDRNNIGLILSAQAQTRFSDYEFEALTSSIYFKAPVPSLDANLNPYSIRVTVEVEEDTGEDYWVGGVQVEQKLGDKLTVGAAAVQEDDPVDAYQLGSVNASLKLAENTKIIAEFAQSDRESKDIGKASRAELTHVQGRLNARVYYGESDTAFDNPAAPLSSGRAESGVKLQVNMNSWGSLNTEAIRTENTSTGGVRHGVKATVTRSINQYLSAELGGRFYDETAVPANNIGLGVTPYEGVTVHSKLNLQLPQVDGASVYGEYEQDIEQSDRKVIAIGGDYRINQQSKLYARHELTSSLSGAFALNDQQQRNSTVVGVESNYMKDGRVFSEYRVRDAINAQDVEAAIGLRNAWYLTEGLRLNTNFEQVRTLEGSDTSDAIATSLGIEYLANPLWKATGKIDLRWADSSDTVLNTLGFAYKLSRDWTLLTKNILSLTDNHALTSGNRIQNRFQLGAAYRQVDVNRWDALTKVEYKLDDNQTSAANLIETEAYIFSTHINYHPTRRWTFSNQYAAKWLTDRKNDISSDSTTYLVGGRVLHDMTERWEASLQAGWLSGDIGGERLVLGAETGYLVTTNLWLSVGYNWLSYQDADLVGTDFTVDGAYLRLRFKFDEDLFGATKPATNKVLEPKNVSR